MFRSRIDPLFSVRTATTAVIAVALILIAMLAVRSLVLSRRQYRAQAEITTQNLCRVLARDLAGSYEKIDLAVLHVQDEAEKAAAAGDPDNARLDALIRRELARIPVLFGLRTTDTDGIIRHGNEVKTGTPVSVADRDYFQILKSNRDARLVLSNPVIGKLTGKPTIMLARRISAPDGSFRGVVYGTIDLSKLVGIYDSLAIGAQGVVTLRNENQAVIVSRGSRPGHFDERGITPEYEAMVQSGFSSGTISCVSQTDGVARIYSFTKIEPYGQFLCVGLGENDVFRPWRAELWSTVGLVILFVVLLGGSIWLADRAWRLQTAAELRRERLISDLKEALNEVKVLRGMIPICSHCKKIRDDRGYWNQLETYISSRSEAVFTHSLCPDCMKQLYSEVLQRLENPPDP